MPAEFVIDNRTARHLALQLQGLSEPPRRKLDQAGLLQRIEELGFVQLDSISTVERAHHMILFSRNETYRQDQLKTAHDGARLLFENWTHDAAVIPMAFYPYWNRRFQRSAPVIKEKYERWHGVDFGPDIAKVLGRIENDGAISSRAFAEKRNGTAGGWWNWHGGKIALEFLWRTGRIAVARRDSFQKVYDLTSRIVPAHLHAALPDHDDFVDWHCRTALHRLGFASPGDIARFWDALSIEEARAWCAITPLPAVTIDSADGSPPRRLVARPDIEALLAGIQPPPPRLRALSPFDPLIRDRKRLSWLFGFDYRIEVFVPAAQRRYGYYVFPLLEGDGLIGRLDMKADRAARVLRVTGLWLEPGIRLAAGRRARLDAELGRICRLAGLDSWSLGEFALEIQG